MKYNVYGPFEMPRKNSRLITRDPEERKVFWDCVDEAEDGLSDACGCYVFAIRRYPWYIGLAEKQSFRDECFTPQKITKYDSALSESPGRPQMFLLAKLTRGADRWARPGKNGHIDIQMLESLLIGVALARNPDVENIRGTKLLREMNVPGVLNSRKGQTKAHSVQALRKVLDT